MYLIYINSLFRPISSSRNHRTIAKHQSPSRFLPFLPFSMIGS